MTVERAQPVMATETKNARRHRHETLACRSSDPALPPVAAAHEVRPAYLQIRQTGLDTYDMLWKVPGRGDNLRLGLYVELPTDCVRLGEPRASFVNNAFTERWT